MHKTKDQLYQQIKDIKSKEEFKKEIDKIQKEYDNLFNEDTAALLIVDELGRNRENISKINKKVNFCRKLKNNCKYWKRKITVTA